jgi:hypothetical protein
MKIVIAIVLAAILTGCVHNVPCPAEIGKPGELCSVLMIPTPADAFTDSTDAAMVAKEVFGSN